LLRWHTFFAVVLSLAAMSQSQAHRLPEGVTTISSGGSGETVDIVHRLHVHDAELGLAELLQNPQLTLDTLEMQARFALYVEQQFKMLDKATGKPLTLVLVGAELEGDYILVYQQVEEPLPIWLSVRNGVLRDVFPDQINKVNFAMDAGLRTLMFAGGDEWKDLQLPR
jgi:hypothetical protein